MNDNNFSKLQGADTPQTLNRILNVPIYQRLFVWEGKQILQLLNDLKDAYRENCDERPYYIGIVTLVQTEKEGQKVWDILDGQQRLTFLTLLGAFAKGEDWKKFVFAENKQRIHYFGRPEDESDIQKIWNGKESAVNNPNFRFFLECIQEVKRELGEDGFSNFNSYVYKKASFLVSELPGEYSPIELNRFFEKMNAAGRQLTPVEQLKGKYFPLYAAIFDDCLNFEKKYEENSGKGEKEEKTLIDILKDTTEPVTPEKPENISVDRYAHRSILRPAVLLLHVLRLTLNSNDISLDENKLLETFKRNSPNCEKFIETLGKYRKWLDVNIIYLQYRDSNSLEYAFRNDEDGLIEDDNYRKKLRQFQSMLYVSSSDAQEWVLDAYKASHAPADGGLSFLELLKRQDAERHPLNENEAMSYPTINRYWFWKLDYLLWEKMVDDDEKNYFDSYDLDENEKKAIREYLFRPNRSIEHLHPQNPNETLETWPLEALNGFGNLAMISSSFNSMQSNDSIATKFGRVKDQVSFRRLESIKLLLMFKKANGVENGWTLEIANGHAEDMYSLLKKGGR